MKKNILTLINAVILCVGLAACGNGIKQYPFKAVAENIVEFVESVVNKPDLKNDETFNKDFRDKQESLLKKMVGTAIATTIDEGLGFELIGEKGDIINTKEGGWAREKVEILIKQGIYNRINFAVSKDKSLFDLLIQKIRWGRPRD